ncbi:sensor histidine kinase [Micromonospora sp. NPDC003197]
MVNSGRLGLRQLMALDALVGAALVLFTAVRTPGAPALVWGLAALFCLPLTVRRHWPVQVLTVVTMAGTMAIAVGIAGDAVVLAIAYAIYVVALSVVQRQSRFTLVGVLAAVTAGGLVSITVPGLPIIAPQPGEESFTTTPVPVLLYSATIIAGSWALARAVRARRQQVAQLAELRADQAVAEERLRIARDIHDVVGHNLSLIAMKAAVANHLADSHPDQGRAALRTIERVSRSALDDVRVVLGALRDPADTAPSFTELDRLVEDIRTTGITVDVERAADLSPVPAVVQASAYRIVQEALTNVLRHAGPTHCQLTVTVEPGVLSIAVVDDGTVGRSDGPRGHGVRGMRERAAMHGGTLKAGFESGGGYAVRAQLPFSPMAPDDE